MSVTLPDPDELGGAGGPVTEYGYDFAGNLTNVTQEATADHEAPETDYIYDDLYRLIQVTQPEVVDGQPGTRPETTYRYDLAGQQVGMSDPVGRDTA